MSLITTIIDGIRPDEITGLGGANEGHINGLATDILSGTTGGVVNLSGGHALVTQAGTPNMTVLVADGVVYIPNSSFDESIATTTKFWRVVIDSESAKTIANNSSGSTRIDLVCVKVDKTVESNEFGSNVSTIVIVAGTPGAGVPATPNDHYKLAEVTVVNGETAINTADITDRRTQMVIDPIFLLLKADGWIATTDTWTYSAYDATYKIGTFTITGDRTTLLYAGDKVKFTQSVDGQKYGIIVSVSYSNPTTTVKIYLGTLYDLDNAAITAPYYSRMKSPAGFPMSPSSWTIETSDTTFRSQSTPTQNTWYNPGSIVINIPIGLWNVSYQANMGVLVASAANVDVQSTLSTANNSASDADFISWAYAGGATGAIRCYAPTYKQKILSLAANTPYYLNIRTTTASMSGLEFNNQLHKLFIKAVCAYL